MIVIMIMKCILMKKILKKKNKNKENLMIIEEDEKNNIKLKSEENKKNNNFFFKKEKFQDTNSKNINSQTSLKSIFKLNKEKKYNNNDNNENKIEENKNKIIIRKTTEQNLITEENKIAISQMKTMEDFLEKPKKKRSIKNISLANKLVLNKKNFHSIHNYKNNFDSKNINILKEINYNENEKKDNNKLILTSNDANNPIKIRDIIIKNRFNKRDSLVSNKKLIIEDSEEEKQIIKKKNLSNKKELRKNQSVENHKNNIIKSYNDSKILENSIKNKSLNEKTKQPINIMIKKEKIDKNITITLYDYLPLDDAKNRDYRSFLYLYWNILSLNHSIINLFYFIAYFNITKSYTPFQIKFIKIIFMLLFNLFINSLLLTQDYFIKKLYYFDKIYHYFNLQLENSISFKEKLKYSMNHNFPRIMISFLICLFVQTLIEHIFFCERKKIYKFLISKSFTDVNNFIDNMDRKIRIKYNIYLFINYIIMITFFIYLSNFTAVYIGGITDIIGSGILTFILLQISPLITSLIIVLLRYHGLKKSNNLLYKFSQILLH